MFVTVKLLTCIELYMAKKYLTFIETGNCFNV